MGMINVLSKPEQRLIWLPMASIMMIHMSFYFCDVTYLGRSYMERDDGSSLSPSLDFIFTLYRAFETVLDAAVQFYILFKVTNWLDECMKCLNDFETWKT